MTNMTREKTAGTTQTNTMTAVAIIVFFTAIGFYPVRFWGLLVTPVLGVAYAHLLLLAFWVQDDPHAAHMAVGYVPREVKGIEARPVATEVDLRACIDVIGRAFDGVDGRGDRACVLFAYGLATGSLGLQHDRPGAFQLYSRQCDQAAGRELRRRDGIRRALPRV